MRCSPLARNGARSLIAAAALAAATSACSSSSSVGTGTAPPTAIPTSVVHVAAFTINEVLDARPLKPGRACPSATKAFPHKVIVSGDVTACDPRDEMVLLLARPALDQAEIAGSVVSRAINPNQWVVDVQLSTAGARAFFDVTRAAYESDPSGAGLDSCRPARCNALALVYEGVVISAPAVAADGIQGGLVQIPGLSKTKAKQIAASLNPS